MRRLSGAGFALVISFVSLLSWGEPLTDTASAQASVNVTIPARVSVTQINDVDLGIWSGTGGLESEQQICVWSSTGAYSLAATTTEGKKGYAMAGPTNKQLDYSVFWDTGSGYQELQSGQTYSGLSTSARSIRCDKGDDPANQPSLKVAIAEKDLNSAKAGQYGDVLQILITTE